MPRLLSLNTYHYRRGGSDAVYFEHDRLFHEHGWETAMFAMHHPKNEVTPWSAYFIDELEFGHAYSPMQKLVMAGKVIYSFEARRKLDRLIDAFRPDIAHAHCIYHHISPSVLPLLKSRGIPTVMTAHDLKLACPAYKMLNRSGICEKCRGGNLLHLISNRCVRDSLAVSSLIAVESAVHKSLGLYRRYLDKVVAPSRFFQDKLIEWGWPREQIVYIPNFIEAERFVPQFTPGDYFFYFGRLAPEKGIATLVKAAVRTGVKLRIAGTGPEEGVLKELASGQDNIEFLGYRSGDELWRLLREARAVVLPSEWYENAPMSVLEAYASGKPVIGARIGGIPEMIREGETGWLFTSGADEELAALLGMVKNADDDSLRHIGAQCRKLAQDTYNKEGYFRDMQVLYNDLLAKRHS